MRSRRIVVSLCAASLASLCLVVNSGCNAGSGEIQLAKVSPPPEGFGKANAKAKIPKTGSPVNANELRK
jgi:hypothetical protein